jgi:uncharacterized protein (DUF58 family)
LIHKTPGKTALGRYLNARILSRLMHARVRPRGRVIGDLAGDHKSPFAGFAVEFSGHREYVPGDDLKHIDWRVYYKQNRYYIKQYEAETNLIAHILLDASESMMYGEGAQRKWDYAATLAATLSYLVVRKRDKAGFAMFDDSIIQQLPPSQSLLQPAKMDRLMEGHRPVAKTDMQKVLMELAPRLGRRAVVMIISDCFDEVERVLRGIQRFHYDAHDVVLFHVMHRDEMSFPFDGNIRFEGLEGYPEIKTDAQQVRARYREVVSNFLDRLGRGCEKSHVEYILMDTSVPVEITLARYLAGRA